MESEGKRRAAVYAERVLGQLRRDRTWLTEAAELDPGTVADFLDGKRWPRTTSRNAIEAALGLDQGVLKHVAEGWGVVDEQTDAVEAAIEASADLSRGQKLRLRSVYVDMLEGRDGVEVG